MNDTTRDELVTEVIDIYAEPENFPREDASDHAERILRLIDEAVAARDAEIRELLLTHADGYIVARGQDREAAFATKPWMEQILNAIGLHGNGTGGQG